jgi:hypothetical protein
MKYVYRGMHPPCCNIPMVATQESCLLLDTVVTGTVQDGWWLNILMTGWAYDIHELAVQLLHSGYMEECCLVSSCFYMKSS